MKTEQKGIAGVPAIIIGERSDAAYLFVHGKMGSKDEVTAFARLACPAGCQVVGIDLPEHGSRKGEREKLIPWVAVPEIKAVYTAMKECWRHIGLRANSIGAWFSMLALQEERLEKALFVSPVVDIEDLIQNMMRWAGVTEPELQRSGQIPTDFGETLSWDYLHWVREHPLRWNVPAEILYAGQDHLTARSVINAFAAKTGSRLTVMETGEHWFHTEEQLCFLHEWEKRALERNIDHENIDPERQSKAGGQ